MNLLARMLTVCSGMILFGAVSVSAQTPSPTLLVLEKSDDMLAFVDLASLKVVARLPAGKDPHEIIASDDGKLAYISNYGGGSGGFSTITVVDLATRKVLSPIDVSPLRAPHGLAFAGGKLYFTAETNKAFGRYDPATQHMDWILGTGQDATHMITVSKDLNQIVTSNVGSGTISLIEQTGAAPRTRWAVTSLRSGNGVEGFDVSPDGKEIWGANAKDNTATIIDAAAKKVVQTVPISVTTSNRLKFTPDGKQVLISGVGDNATSAGGGLAVLDAVTRKEIKSLDLGGGCTGILVEPDGKRAYVAVYTAAKIAVVDLKSLKVVGHISTGNQPDGMAWVSSTARR